MVKRSLTHLDDRGRATMVDVGSKPDTVRIARAEALVRLGKPALAALLAGKIAKGEALAVARLAGIMAAKDTARLIPLCHPLMVSAIRVDLAAQGKDAILVTTEARCLGPTGVEMEAMTAASVAALTLYDMCKALERGITIEHVRLTFKSGGASGTWNREDA